MLVPSFRIRLLILPLLFILVPLTACDGLEYVLLAAEGQFSIVGATEPIDDVLASGRLSEDDETKLRLLVKAREYAAGTIGLTVGNSYLTFYDSSGDPVAFSLTATPRDGLDPVTWSFPFFGEQENLMFFDEQYLDRIEQGLLDDGFDTYHYEVDAYSTIGFFEDPIRSPMLRRHTVSAVDTIFHELLHNTIWRVSESVFNESLATFVGRTAGVEFLLVEFGEDSGWAELAEDYYSDLDTVNAFLFELYYELDDYYAGPLSSEELIAGREAVYQAARERFTAEIMPLLNYPDVFSGYADMPTNNARMRLNYRYNMDLDVFEQVFTIQNRDWAATLNVFRAAATSTEDPFDYLREWVRTNGE